MKVIVEMKVKACSEFGSFKMSVNSSDTVSAIKDRIDTLHAVPFPKKDLVLNGKAMADSSSLEDCGVTEGAKLVLSITASEDIVVDQLSEILKSRDLTFDEVGLLYSYKHGASVAQALQMVGLDCKLQDFVKKQKRFSVSSVNGRITLIRDDTALKPFSVRDECLTILNESHSGCMDIKDMNAKFLQKFGVSIHHFTGMKPGDFLRSEPETFYVVGRGPAFVHKADARRTLAAAAPGPQATPVVEAETDSKDQKYLDLHTTISSESFNAKACLALNDTITTLMSLLFLNVVSVVKAGAIGKGLVISSDPSADLTFFCNGLPTRAYSEWLPQLLRAVAAGLEDKIGAETGLNSMQVKENCIELCVNNFLKVNLSFAPSMDNFSEVMEALEGEKPQNLALYAPALAGRRVWFMAKQPKAVKMTIRLLKWWRSQHEWAELCRPCDDVLELLSVYSALKTQPVDQEEALGNVMALMSNFKELRIIWSNFYQESDIRESVLAQTPLLMDPCNPHVNVADPKAFDPSQMMELAKVRF